MCRSFRLLIQLLYSVRCSQPMEQRYCTSSLKALNLNHRIGVNSSHSRPGRMRTRFPWVVSRTSLCMISLCVTAADVGFIARTCIFTAPPKGLATVRDSIDKPAQAKNVNLRLHQKIIFGSIGGISEEVGCRIAMRAHTSVVAVTERLFSC